MEATKSTLWSELKTCFWLCPRCKLCLRAPKVLPCLHTFCQECLEDYIGESNSGSSGKFKCPECKSFAILPQKGIISFAKNNYIEQLQRSNGHSLDMTGERSVDLCCCYLCDSYRQNRNSVEEKEKKKALDTEKAEGDLKCESSNSVNLVPCEYHIRENVLYFCTDCQQANCRICIELRHRDHRFEPISLAVENSKLLLKTTKDVLLVRQDSNNKTLKKLQMYSDDLSAQKEKALADVENCISQMHNILDTVKGRIIDDVNRLYVTENGTVSKIIEELMLSQQQLEGVKSFLDAHEGHDPSEIVQQRFLITDRVNQLYVAEHQINFPMEITFTPAIPGFGKERSWKYLMEVALKNAVGSVTSGRLLANDFISGQIATRGEVNKAILIATYSLGLEPNAECEHLYLDDKTRRQSISSSRPAKLRPSVGNEVPLTRYLLPSLTIDPYGYLFSLDRTNRTVARFFGGCDIPRRAYHFPPDRCRPLRVCSVGWTGGYAYVDAFSPTASSNCFSLKFVPRTGDKFDLLLPLDRYLFSGSDIGMLDSIPALCADQNSNIYILDIDSNGCTVLIAYSMSFGSVRKIILEPGREHKNDDIIPSQRKRVSNVSIAGVHETIGEETTHGAEEEVSRTGVVSADFRSYVACCRHTTGTREVISPSNQTTCQGIFAVADTMKNTVKFYDILGILVADLVVPSPLDPIKHPRGVAFDHFGNFVVCDHGNNRVLLYDHSGRRLRSILATGPPALEALRSPCEIVTVPGKYQCCVAEETTNVVKHFDYSSLVVPQVIKKSK